MLGVIEKTISIVKPLNTTTHILESYMETAKFFNKEVSI